MVDRPVAEQPGAPTPAAGRRWPLPLIATAVFAGMLIVAGALMLRNDSNPSTPSSTGSANPPTVLRGSVSLEFRPGIMGVRGPGATTVYVAGVRLVSGLSLRDDALELTTIDTSTILDALLPADTGPVALTFRPEIIEYPMSRGDASTVVELPTANCCADVLAAGGGGDVVAFPELSGRSSAYWVIDLEGGTWDEYPLPQTITVTSAVDLDGILYVGHTNGLIAISMLDECRGEIASWDVPTAALSVSLADNGDPSVSALDTQNQAIAVIDPLGERRDVSGCGVMESPTLAGTVNLNVVVGGESYQSTLATVGTTAYVIDRAGMVHVVDISTPSNSRLVTSLSIPDSPTRGVSLAAIRDEESSLWSVFVVDRDGARVFWIASTGDETPNQTIDVARR